MKLEIGYVVKIKTYYDNNSYNGKEGAIIAISNISRDIYTVRVFDDKSTTNERNFYSFELSETIESMRNRKLIELGY